MTRYEITLHIIKLTLLIRWKETSVSDYFSLDFQAASAQPNIHSKLNCLAKSAKSIPTFLFCDWFSPTLKGTNLPPHQSFFFLELSKDFCFFALIYPGNICQAHMLSFINTLFHTYKVTHIHTWLLPSATTVFYCQPSGQLYQSNLDILKFAEGHYYGCSWRSGEQVTFMSPTYILLGKSKIQNLISPLV